MVLLSRSWGSSSRVQGDVIPNVDTYPYLGVLIRQDMSFKDAIEDRVKKTRGALANIQEILKWKNLSQTIKLRILQTMVGSVALYGAEVYSAAGAKTVMAPITKVYNEGVRMACGFSDKVNVDLLLKEHGIFPLYIQARMRCFRQLHTYLAVDSASAWPKALCARTRGLGQGRLTWHQTILNKAQSAGWNVRTNEPINQDKDQKVKSLPEIMTAVAKAELEKQDSVVRQTYTENFWKTSAEAAEYIKKSKDTKAVRLMTAFRVGHIALPKYLKMAGVVYNDECQNCKNPLQPGLRRPSEGRTHVLIDCPAWSSIRKEWYQAVNAIFQSKSKKSQKSTELHRKFQSAFMNMDADKKALYLLGGEVTKVGFTELNNRREEVATVSCKFIGDIFRARLTAEAERASK